MLRNICLITLSAYVLVFAAGSKTNPREHGGDGSRGAHELTGTITSHNEHNNSFVIDDKDTIYYNDQTVFSPQHEKAALLRPGSKVKVRYMNREGDKVAERVEKAAAENRRTNTDKDTTKDTTKNKSNSAAGDAEKDTNKDKSKSGAKDKDDKDSKKGESKNKERGKDRGAEPDSVPYPEGHEDRGEGW